MTIKIQCSCGTRFEFEVEPVGGRMPMAIHCPTCNADDTELANVVIREKSAGAPAPASGLKVAGLHKAPMPAPAPAPVAQPDTGTESAALAQLCPKHQTETAVEVCCVCGKPICLKCMEQFGYVCSVYCRQQATAKRIYVPVYAQQKSVIAGRSHVMAKRITVAVTTFVVLFLGLWVWYAWFARNYKVAYSLDIPQPDPNSPKAHFKPDDFYQLIAPGQLLSIKGKQISLYDVPGQKSLWSTPLQTDSEKTAPDENDFYDFSFGGTRVITTSNDVWVASLNHLARFDRQTGSRKDTGIKDKIIHLTAEPDAILVVSGVPKNHETLSKIALPDGTIESEDIVSPPPPKVEPTPKTSKPGDKVIAKGKKDKSGKQSAAVDQVPVGQIKTLASNTDATAEPDDADSALAMFENERQPFISAGPNVVAFKTKLLEHKTISHVAMKPKGKSLLDNPNVNASQGLDLAQEMMNDSRREATGGVEVEDVSRYQFTIHRLLEKNIPDWTAEVNGQPQFFSLKTVDIVTAGQGLYVFDKHNKKLWEAKLTFAVPPRFSADQAPCLETKDSLYFADLGMLTRFDLATGNVRWRYNSVGISEIQTDDRGGIYLATTTAGPEQIKYSQQVNLHDKIHPVILKLTPETGKVIWHEESLGDHLMLSGGFLYTTRVSQAYAALHLEQGPDTHYNLNLLEPSNGRVIWNYHRGNHRLIKTEVQKNWILVHLNDEVVVLRFFSL